MIYQGTVKGISIEESSQLEVEEEENVDLGLKW